MPLRSLALCLLLAGCTHTRVQGENPRPETPGPVVAASRADTPPPAAPAAAPMVQRVDFTHDVRPILEARCQPCHFTGGRMYGRLPFDRPETIRQLGTRLFTRIKAENEQGVIRQFLAQDQ